MKPIARLDYGTGRRRIRIRVYGDETAPPVLLVHGLCGSGAWWRKNLPALVRSHRVLIVELAGYGTNRAPLPIPIQEAARSLAGLIATLPEGRADVVGHSMGGQIAMHLAAHFPERVDRLILVSASGGLGVGIVSLALRLPVEALSLTPSFAPVLALDALRCGPLNLLASTREIVGDDISGQAPRISAPTLLIWGRDDHLVPVSVGVALAQRIPGARLEIIEHAGHVVLWDQAERFNALVTQFLQRPNST